ncbi:amidohydrolase family protein [Actinomycetaceae bacterium L2_0104]
MKTILTNARIQGADETSTLVITDGIISDIIDGTNPAPTGDNVEDLGGEIVIPGFIDGHAHVDKSLLGEPWVRRTSSAVNMNQMFHDQLKQWEMPTAPVKVRARRFIEECIKAGTTTLQTCADVAPQIGLEGVEALLELREEMKDSLDIKIIAFAQMGLQVYPGTEELIEEAAKLGVDGVAAVDPADVDHDAIKTLDAIFRIAETHGTKVDFHAHEAGHLGEWLVDRIAERTKALGMEGKVTLCDLFCLSGASPQSLDHLSHTLSDAGIGVAIGVHGLLPVPDVRRLHDDGVALCLGSDSSRWLWAPWGDGDILMRAMMMAYKQYWRTDDDLEFALRMATEYGRRFVGLPEAGIEVGAPADLVVLPGQALAETVVFPPKRSLVMKNGKIVARNGDLTV